MSKLLSHILFIVDGVVSLLFTIGISVLFTVVKVYKPSHKLKNRILFIDTSYSYNKLVETHQEQSIFQRDLDGFFEKTYTLYPILGAHPQDRSESFAGVYRFINMNERHTFIECKIGFSALLRTLPRINFILSQSAILFRMRTLIIKESISIVRGNDPFLTGLYAYLLSRTTNAFFAMRIGANHDLLYQNGIISFKNIFKWYFIEKIIARYLFPRAALVFAATKNYLDYALDNGAGRDRSFVTRFGDILDPAHYTEPKTRTIRRKELSFADRRYGVYVGRLAKVKHAEDLIDVAFTVRKKHPETLIVIVGEGPLAEEMKERAKELNCTDSICFFGNSNQEQISILLACASAYLSPHSGRALTEAALAGIPLIAYDFEWQAEIVKQGVTGELVAYRDADAMAKSFCKILDNTTYAVNLGKEARKLALDIGDSAKIKDLEKDKYSALFNSRKSDRR
jgi:glycosyltransferase involved in cell wall biosynthesis